MSSQSPTLSSNPGHIKHFSVFLLLNWVNSKTLICLRMPFGSWPCDSPVGMILSFEVDFQEVKNNCSAHLESSFFLSGTKRVEKENNTKISATSHLLLIDGRCQEHPFEKNSVATFG